MTLHLGGDCTGNAIRTTVTDQSGIYSFTHLLAGVYCIQFGEFPAGWVISPQNVGDDDTVDSDADHKTAQINDINLSDDNLDEDVGIHFVPVGGTTTPTNKAALLAPWIGLAALMGLLVAGMVTTRRKRVR